MWCAWHGTCSSVLDLLCLFFGVILSFVHGIWASVCFSVDSVQSVSQLVFLHAQHRLVYLHCASPWHWPWFMCLALHIVLLAPSAFAQLADLHVLWLRPPVAFVVEPPLPLWISPPLLRLLLIPLRICLLCLCRTLAIPVGLPRSRVCFTPVIFVFPLPCPPGVRRLIAFLLLVFMMAIKKILALSFLPSVLCSLNGLLSIFGLSIAMPRALCASLSSHLSF